MRTIRVNVGSGYDVKVGGGLLSRCGEEIKKATGAQRVAVVTDSNVGPLYAERVMKSIEEAGCTAFLHTFEAGEPSKNMTNLAQILEFLAQSELGRGDCVTALGGGVTGDMAGFAAGCYLRGIKFVQLPTTLLAAVDSSVGGKTAVDLPQGKNLAGLFHQPSLVLCDTDTLATLPAERLADGVAEAVKTAILFDAELFALFEKGFSLERDAETVITRCVECKAGVVERDERESGERRLLNLGHTVGHAIELCSGYSITHGFAVAAGTAIIARAAEKLGWTTEPVAERIEKALAASGLPTDTEYSAEELARAAMNDKKRSGGTVTFIVPETIGRCAQRAVPTGEMRELIETGLRK